MMAAVLDSGRLWKPVPPLAAGLPVAAVGALAGLPAGLALTLGLTAAIAFVVASIPLRRAASREQRQEIVRIETQAVPAPDLPSAADEHAREKQKEKKEKEEVRDHLAAYDQTFERAATYTSSVVDDTNDAAHRIVSGLKAMETAIEDVLGFLETSSTNQKVMEIVDNTDRQLAENRRLISDFIARRDQDIESWRAQIGDIDRMTDDLSHAIDGIRGIASQTRLLALNAAIEASHAGKHGAGFSVVATEVKHLSDASSRTAHQVGQGLGKLRASIRDKLTVLVSERMGEEQRELEHIASSISDLTAQMECLVAHQRDTLGKVQVESHRMVSPVLKLLGSIQFQDVAQQRIRHVEMFFSRAREDIAAVNDALASRRDLPAANELRAAIAQEGPAAPRAEGSYTEIEMF
jgi:methyl-accepting chemotaxis protein